MTNTNTTNGLREEIAQELFSTSYEQLEEMIKLQIDAEVVKSARELIEAKIKSKHKQVLTDAKSVDMTLNAMDSLSNNLFSNNLLKH